MHSIADVPWEGPHDKIVLSPRHGGRVIAWDHDGSGNLVREPQGLEGGLLRTLLLEERYPGHSYCTAHLVTERRDGPRRRQARLRYFWYTPNVFARLFGWTDKLCPRYLDGLLLDKLVTFDTERSVLLVDLTITNLAGGPRQFTPWVQNTFRERFQQGFVYWDGQRRAYNPSGGWWVMHPADGAAAMRVVHSDSGEKLFVVTGANPQPLAGMLKYDPADFGPGATTAMQELRYRPVRLGAGDCWQTNYFVAAADVANRWAADAPEPLYAQTQRAAATEWDENSLLSTLDGWALPEELERGLMVLTYLDKLPFTSDRRHVASHLLGGFHPAGRGQAAATAVLYATRAIDDLRVSLAGHKRWRVTAADGTPLPARISLHQHHLLQLRIEAPADLAGKDRVSVRVATGAGVVARLRIPPDTRVGPRYAYQFQQMAPYLEERVREEKLEFRGATRAEFWAWQRRTRASYRRWMRESVRGRCPLAPRLLERQVGATCVRDKIAIQTEPGMWLPSYVVYPRRAPARMPALILFHGSGPGKEAYAPDEDPEGQGDPCIHDLMGMPYALARRLHCLVYIPDQRSQGEWGEWFSAAGAKRTGYNTLAMRMWDHTRSLDYLCARPDVDPAHIGCLGSSGGGMATMYTAGIDERVRTGILSSMPPYLVRLPDQFFNDLWSDGDLGGEWAPLATTPSITPNVCALTIPRPLWIMDGKEDTGLWEGDPQGDLTGAFAKWQAARDEVARLYALAGVPERFRQTWFPGGHCAGMTVPNAVEWFRRWL